MLPVVVQVPEVWAKAATADVAASTMASHPSKTEARFFAGSREFVRIIENLLS
jgi:hypothetical protein